MSATNPRVSKLKFVQKCQVYALVLAQADFAEIAEYFGVTTRTVKNIQNCSKESYEHVYTDFMFRGSKLKFCQLYITDELQRAFPNLVIPKKGE